MKKLLFVCMGNICRSPAAEAVMKNHLKASGLSDQVSCDSAGTIGNHAGKAPDRRMIIAGRKRGLDVCGKARQVTTDDFHQYDMMVCMDRDNRAALERMAPSETAREKIVEMARFFRIQKEHHVPDPYYGDEEGFTRVLELLEDGCTGLLSHLKTRWNL